MKDLRLYKKDEMNIDELFQSSILEAMLAGRTKALVELAQECEQLKNVNQVLVTQNEQLKTQIEEMKKKFLEIPTGLDEKK
jgi:cell division protein FtsB